MSSAYRYLPSYTVEDYQTWEGDWELWQGIPVSMTPSPFGRHQKLATRLATSLQNAVDAVQCDATVFNEIDWIISDDTVVRPDVLVLCGDAPARHVETTPAIVAEILSTSTGQRDRTAKFDLYQDNGAKYYLIIDPDNDVLTAFALDESGVYKEHPLGDEIVFDICDECSLHVAVAQVFR